MRSSPARLGSVSLLAIVGAMASCAATKDPCAAFDEALSTCGLPATDDACAAVPPAVRDDLLQRVDQRGCEGLASGEGAVDPRLCRASGWPCPDPIGPEPSGARPHGPVLFVSGIDATPTFDWSARLLDELADAAEIEHVGLRPWATTAERAADLWDAVERARHGREDVRVNLICYAVGGLDCRFVVSPAGLFAGDDASAARARAAIASVTTIATPHRGTRVADTSLDVLESDQATAILDAFVGEGEVGLASFGRSKIAATLRGLTLDAGRTFDAEIVDADGVLYQSWAGVASAGGRVTESARALVAEHCVSEDGLPLLYGPPGAHDRLHDLLTLTAPFGSATLDDEGRRVTSPTDGMIAVASAKHGLFRGCLPADHYDVIGQIGHVTRDPRTGFDAARFYRFVLGDLAARGL